MRKVPRSVVDHDKREVMSLLRLPATLRREAGLLGGASPSTASAAAAPSSSSAESRGKEELTLLQGACLDGGSAEIVAMLLVNGASPNITTPVTPLGKGKGGRGTRLSGGYPPLLLALIGCGRERNKVVKELLVYGADVNIKDAEGFSFLDLTTRNPAYTSLHQFIAQAAKDPRSQKAQEASVEVREQQRQAMQREQKEIERPGPAFEAGPLLDPIDSLPPELSVHIFSFFTLGQLARACLVSSLWRCVASDYDLWRRLYIAQVGPVPHYAEHSFQELLQRGLALKAALQEKERMKLWRQTKLVMQIINHPRCDHRSHSQQVSIPALGLLYRRYSGSSIVCSFDTLTQQKRANWSGYMNINCYIPNQEALRVTHDERVCKVRCTNFAGRRKTYDLKIGDKLSVLTHHPQSGSCRVYFFSFTSDHEADHLVAPKWVHLCNQR